MYLVACAGFSDTIKERIYKGLLQCRLLILGVVFLHSYGMQRFGICDKELSTVPCDLDQLAVE